MKLIKDLGVVNGRKKGIYECSQSEASRQTGISQGNIGQALRGTRTQSGGYKWQYQMN